MKHLIFAVLIAVAFTVAAGEMTVTIPVNTSAIQIEEAGPYTCITGMGMRLTTAVGAPSLPVLTAKIALPTGCAATEIEIIDEVYSEVRGNFTVLPARPSFPLSIEQEIHPLEPDPDIYTSSESYPSAAVEFMNSSVIMGIPVAYISVYPVRWNPASRTLEVLTSLTVNVIYESSPAASTVLRRSIQSELRSQDIVRSSVVNPDNVSRSGAAIVDSGDLLYGEYVIITHPDYESHAQELADWKTSKGVPTGVYTTTWVEEQYSLFDLQQEIRAFLTDCIDEGVEYVLIFGDDDKVAGRDVRISLYGYYIEFPPVDLYWSDINDDFAGEDLWDSNQNHIWGEWGIDNIDYHPDLWVGRASVNSTDEADIFNEKVFAYERISSSIQTGKTPIEIRIGYTTGFLFDSNPDVWGYTGAELISFYVPLEWAEERCFEFTGNNSSPITIDMINAGPHHVYHASHGSQTVMYTSYGSNYNTNHIMAQENISNGHLPAIWNSISCLIGQLDEYECCGDAWLNSPNGGGFGAFNARYGWGSYVAGYGPSEILSRYFYEVMWGSDQYHLGVAHLMASDLMYPSVEEIDDWCVKEYNLFGDPELPMWFNDAEQLSASHPVSISGTGNVTVNVTSFGSAVSGARVCLQKGDWQTGEVYEVGTTDASGNVTLYVSPATTGTMSVVSWARDFISYQGSIDVTDTGFEESEGNPVYTNNLDSVYPNPAMASVTIPFSLAAAGVTRVDIYDITGRIVTTLAAEEITSGHHNLPWNLEDGNGTAVPSGIYHVRVSTGDWTGVTNLVVTR